jgi:hypothetical protein
MADIMALARSARLKLIGGAAIYPIDAVEKAIKGIGIFDKNDLKRLKPKVLSALRKLDGGQKPKTLRRRR